MIPEAGDRSPAFEAFETGYGAGTPQVLWRRIVDDLETPVSAYRQIARGKPYAFLFESPGGRPRRTARARYSIVTFAPDLVWRCRGDVAEISRDGDLERDIWVKQEGGALDSLRALVASSRIDLPAELPPMAAGLFGVLGYDMVRLAEPLAAAKPDPLGLPDAIMTRPGVVAVFDSVGQEIVVVTPVWPSALPAREAFDAAQRRLDQVTHDLQQPLAPAGPREAREQPAFTSPFDQASYGEAVLKAKDYIAAGDIFQVVPSQRFRAPFELDPFALYRSLRRLNPSPFLFFLDFGQFQLAGSSPEILVRLRDGKITIRPIAGTRPRGKTPAEDLALEKELLADPKELAEHLMLLDLGRNDVGRVALLREPGANDDVVEGTAAPTVRVTESFVVERYSHVMHIVSNVEGDAPDGVDPVDVLMAALPAGTLSGAPKVRAMQIIDELEVEKRGLTYAGAAGYISCTGAVDTCILLRTALFKDGMMYVQGGGGVVADSDPVAEYEETLHKSRALRRAAEEAWRFA